MNNKIIELQRAFEQSVKNLTEAFEGLKAEIISVDKPKFEIGDKVRFIGPASEYHSDVTVGEIYEINGFFNNDVPTFLDDLNCHESYSTIDPEYRNLFEKVCEVERVDEIIEEIELTPNEQRAALIERAKVFVERKTESLKDSSEIAGGYGFKRQENPKYCHVLSKVEFVINEEKKTVVALLKWRHGNKIRSKGIAKCMPDDVFNADIGKAIALARALKIDVPEEFLSAVQPTEIVVGMIASPKESVVNYFNRDGRRALIVKELLGDYDTVRRSNNRTCHKEYLDIIDDTNAIYGGAKS